MTYLGTEGRKIWCRTEAEKPKEVKLASKRVEEMKLRLLNLVYVENVFSGR